MSAILAALARYWQPVAALVGALGVLLYGRHQRGQGAAERETQIRADAARQNQERTDAGNQAARAAERDGAAGRLRDGTF